MKKVTFLLVVTLLNWFFVTTFPLGLAQASTPDNSIINSDIPKPSVPEFTVKLVSHPYNVIPHDSVDPYTGAVTAYPSYVAENKSIEVTIKNQPFNSYQMADGNWSRLYYNLRLKAHFYTDDSDWTYYPSPPETGYYVNASLSEYTVISLDHWLYGDLIRPGSHIDFQAQALIGYDEARYGVSGNTGELVSYGNFFTGETSDWSNTQTLIILASSEPTPSTPSQYSTPNQTTESVPSQLLSQDSTPTQSQQSPENAALFGSWGDIAIIGLFSIIAVLLISVMCICVKRNKNKIEEGKASY